MKIRNWMTPNPLTVTPKTLLMEAKKLMAANNIRRLPVVDKKGRLVGLLTRHLIIEAMPSGATSLSVHELHYLLERLTVGEVMQKDPVTVSPDDLVQHVIMLGHQKGIGAFPVVENGKLVGIVTESEIFQAVMSLIAPREGASLIVLENVELSKEVGATSRIASIIEKARRAGGGHLHHAPPHPGGQSSLHTSPHPPRGQPAGRSRRGGVQGGSHTRVGKGWRCRAK